MKVILIQDIASLGDAGQIVEVKRGYARNYLFPKKIAVKADPKSAKNVDHQRRLLDQKANRELHQAQKLAQELETLSLTLSKKAGDMDKLFGSVTDMDIAKALEDKKYAVSRKMIHLEEPIKSLGVYHVQVKLHPEVEVKVKVWVIKE